MGYGLRYFMAEDDGTLTRVPTARCHRWFAEEEALPADRAGRELRLLEVVVEVDRHRIVDVLRILPVRHWVGADGRLDASAALRMALQRIEISERVSAGDVWAQVEELQADANYFWWPPGAHIEALAAALLKRPPSPADLAELGTVLFRPGASSRDR